MTIQPSFPAPGDTPAAPPIFLLHTPRAAPVPVVASLPHSGLHVPPAIRARFTPAQRAWLRNTDWYLGELYDFLPDLGATVIEATHSRYVADLNRDPAGMVYGDFRSAVVAATNAHGAPVYAEPPGQRELQARLATFHTPWHAVLRALLDDVAARFGGVLLLDLHSFMGPIDDDICLGDVHGASCDPFVTTAVAGALAGQGFGVARNKVYAGGHVVRSHARRPAVQALQVELRYTNYLDCSRIDELGMPPRDPVAWESARTRLRAAFAELFAGLPTLLACADLPAD